MALDLYRCLNRYVVGTTGPVQQPPPPPAAAAPHLPLLQLCQAQAELPSARHQGGTGYAGMQYNILRSTT